MAKVIKAPTGTAITFQFADGSGLEFGSLDDVKTHLREMDSDRHHAQCLLIGWFLARQPEASNVSIVEGKTMTFDLSAANPLRVQ
jgi:hypothetical protein